MKTILAILAGFALSCIIVLMLVIYEYFNHNENGK